VDRFFIDADGPEDQAVRDAVAWLISYAREHGQSEAATTRCASRWPS
jgi:hypothetical protein